MIDTPTSNQQPPQPLYNQQKSNKGAPMVVIVGIVILLLIIGAWLLMKRSPVEPALESEVIEEELPPVTEPIEELLELEASPADIKANTTETRTQVTEVAPSEVKEFTLAASNFKFTPNEIRVQPGETVRLTLTNGSTLSHDWRVDEFQAATKLISTGEEDTIEFTVGQAGMFEFYCSVDQHRQNGMVGKLIVE